LRTLLIDADSFVYSAAKANEYEHRWDDDLWTLHANLSPAISQLDEAVADLKEQLEATDVVMALSDYQDPWRKKVMPTYKSNRKDVRKPVIFKPLRDYVHEVYRTFQRQGLEGDDCLGILATNPEVIQGEKIVVSLDKDMRTIPGKHFNFEKGLEFERDAGDADYFHYTQILTGDSTDGYKGCPGVGPVAAKKILAPFVCECGESGEFWTEFDNAGAWQAIVKAYRKVGLGEDEAIRTGQVSRILRHGDFNYDTKTVRLWLPPDAA
jgi:DNA polymerase-1